jgi:hypothetical protein
MLYAEKAILNMYLSVSKEHIVKSFWISSVCFFFEKFSSVCHMVEN